MVGGFQAIQSIVAMIKGHYYVVTPNGLLIIFALAVHG
jgi:hypothetical protein